MLNYFGLHRMHNRLGLNPSKKISCMGSAAMRRKRVHSARPGCDNVAEFSGRGRHEMRRMPGHARNPRRALIPAAASSGVRAGGFESPGWSDPSPAYADGREEPVLGDTGGGDHGGGGSGGEESLPACATLTAYGRTNSSCPASITAEAYTALVEYREARALKTAGRPKSDGPMPVSLRKNGAESAIWTQAVWKNMARIAVAAGSRDREREGQGRYDIPAMNGFRRFGNKARKNSFSRDSLLPSPIKEHVAGHTGVATPDRHCKAHVREPAVEYMQSASALIIVDAERLRLGNARQARRIGRMQDERDIETAAPKRVIGEMAKLTEGARPVGGRLRRRSRASDRHAKSKQEAADA